MAKVNDEARAEMPPPVNAWLDGHVKQFGPKANKARAERDKKIAELDAAAAPAMEALKKAQSELSQARASLAEAPLDAEIEELVKWQIVVERWPERINVLAEAVQPFNEQRRQIEKDYAAAMRSFQGDMGEAPRKVALNIESAVPNVYDLLD